MNMDPNSILMSGSAKPARFEKVGDHVTGFISSLDSRQQTDIETGEAKTWNDGKPRMMVYAEIELVPEEHSDDPDDDQVRALYIRGQMLMAVREAVKKAKAEGLQKGGKIRVTLTGLGQPKRAGYNPPKIYSAQYRPPAPETVQLPEPANDFEEERPPTPAPKANGSVKEHAQKVRQAAIESVDPEDIPF